MEKSAGEVRRRESIWREDARWFHPLRFARPRLLPEIILWDTEKPVVSGVGCKATPGFELEGLATCSARCCPGRSSPQKCRVARVLPHVGWVGSRSWVRGWGSSPDPSSTCPCVLDAQVGLQQPWGRGSDHPFVHPREAYTQPSFKGRDQMLSWGTSCSGTCSLPPRLPTVPPRAADREHG